MPDKMTSHTTRDNGEKKNSFAKKKSKRKTETASQPFHKHHKRQRCKRHDEGRDYALRSGVGGKIRWKEMREKEKA